MRVLSAAFLALVFMGCNPPATTNTPAGDAMTNPDANSGPPAKDNTRINERDQNPAAKTPIDQNENQRDVQITADIRKNILATEGMSVNARNAKIITADGKVTLRGPVETAEEKSKVESIAADVAGQGNVTSELEVRPKTP